MNDPNVHNPGYNAEEDHFHEKDREALEALRGKLDQQRQQTKDAQERAAHWMKCPKCGHDLVETKMDVVMVDKCTGCEGVFFDAGEVELLLDAHEKNSSLFLKLFRGR